MHGLSGVSESNMELAILLQIRGYLAENIILWLVPAVKVAQDEALLRIEIL